MTILHISDTHSRHNELPPLPMADVVVHSGDVSYHGSEEEVIDFLNWFCDLPHPHKIFIAGNHDLCLYGENIVGLDTNVHYLYHSGVEIDGIKFWGLPLFMEEIKRKQYEKQIQLIPNNIDVLVTHQPPFGILDRSGRNLQHYGCKALRKKVSVLQPKLHLFGHEHNQYGHLLHGTTHFSNAALLNDQYHRQNRTPFLFEIS